ncbi:hypothetical protein AMTRI_Chr04g183210 [Amborella trichopoda]
MRVLYDLSDFGAIGNGIGGISTTFKNYSGHVSCSGSSNLINRTVLVVPLSDHQPIGNRQPRSVLTADMLVRAYHNGGYKLTCQPVMSITSARLCPAQ